jgi:fumarate hydratase subunit beta
MVPDPRGRPSPPPRPKTLRLPLAPGGPGLGGLFSGDSLELEGELIVGRDQAHKRLVAILGAGGRLPFDPSGRAIYYMGPSPAPPGRVIGSAGPTTAGRMDPLTVPLLESGVRVLVGKGRRSAQVREALRGLGGVYLAAVGGAGALYSRAIRKAEVLAFPELGPEALLRVEVEAFPVLVIHDLHGGDLYQSGPLPYKE